MGTLGDYPHPPDAILAILKVLKYGIEQGGFPNPVGRLLFAERIVLGDSFNPLLSEKLNLEKPKDRLSIREAKWIARFSKTIPDTAGLASSAIWYSDMERIYELAGQPFDSTGLDEDFLKHEDYVPTYFRKGELNERSHTEEG
jgi:hypothetical protein